MGCCGDREKGLTVTEQQKWDYIVRRTSQSQEQDRMLTLIDTL